MKCSICDQALDPGRVWIIAAYLPNPHVLNIHSVCGQNLLGRKAWDQLGRMVIGNGWHQLVLPGVPSAPSWPAQT